ncbi:MAG TPA: DUF4397 domain-containing protein [Dokdonella sp.]|nr:DUF4397 domain-containing protein [Dokdonella sp.]
MKTVLSSALAVAALAASSATHADTRVLAAHFAPFSPSLPGTAVSINVNGSEVLTGVQFNQVSGYLPLSGPGVAPGSTQVDVYAPPATPPPAISLTADLAADTDYTIAAIGDVVNQPLALLPLVDDNAAPAPGNVKLRVVHAAPFASSLPATAVSIRTQDGTVVAGLSSVQFGQASGYFEIPAGTVDLEIDTPDGATRLIDPAPVTLAAGTVATLFAVGDGSQQPLGVTAVFGDGTSSPLALQATGGTAPHPAPTLSTWAILLLGAALALVAASRARRLQRVRS